jgi:hypothetical protein
MAEKWGCTRQNASLLIKGSTVADALVARGLPAPANVNTVTPLTRLDDDDAAAVWTKALALAGPGRATSAHVADALVALGLKTPRAKESTTPDAVLERFRRAVERAALDLDGVDWPELTTMLQAEISTVLAEMERINDAEQLLDEEKLATSAAKLADV